MTIRYTPALLALFMGLPVLAGCTTASGDRPGNAAQPAEPAGLADFLVSAAAAEQARDSEALARTLRRIDALGAKPLDDEATAALAHWRSLAGSTTPPLRGRTLGPGFRAGTLPPGKQAAIEQTFLSGQRASIAVSADGAARLALAVTRPKGERVCEDVASRSACKWVPMFTERHRIVVRNPGKQPVRYFLVID